MPIEEQPLDRRSFLAMTAGMAMIAAVPAWARPSRSKILAWEPLVDDVVVTAGTVSGGNVVAATRGASALVVDSKFPHLGEAVRRDVEGLGAESITLVNTHHHGDHTGGNASYVGRGETIAHENLLPRARAQFERYRQQAAGAPSQARDGGEGLIEAAIAIAERAESLDADGWVPQRGVGLGVTEIDLAAMPVELHHFGPGHTDNDLIVRLPDRNVIHTGDVIFNELHPFCDPNGGCDTASWIETLRGIEAACDAETVVVPGHGPVGGPEIVAKMRLYLEALREAVAADIAAGVSRDDAAGKTYPFMTGRGFEQLRARAIAFVYDELSAG